MLQILIVGMTLLMMSSASAPVIKKPVYSCVINSKNQLARCGKRDLNYKHKRSSVGEWVGKPKNYSIHKANNMVCFGLKDWLKKIKPSLKEGHDYWVDKND